MLPSTTSPLEAVVLAVTTVSTLFWGWEVVSHIIDITKTQPRMRVVAYHSGAVKVGIFLTQAFLLWLTYLAALMPPQVTAPLTIVATIIRVWSLVIVFGSLVTGVWGRAVRRYVEGHWL